MRYNFLKLFLILSISTFFKCTSQLKTSSNPRFEFKNGSEKIEVHINNGTPFLELNKENRVIIKVENLDPKSLSVSGQGVRFSPVQDFNDAISLEIKPTAEILQDGKFALNVSYSSNGESIFNKFMIPVN